MAGPNMDNFEAYFKRADLDGDGRISGAEAVAFFQGSGLPKQVLAQVWMHADHARSGFLGRQEFYNALRLVTVAQSKRELTPEIVKAAIHGPAAAKIPAPQINLLATPGQQPNSGASAPQISSVSSTAPQNLRFRGPGAPDTVVSQPYFPPQQNQSMRPTQVAAPLPPLVTASPEYRGNSLPGQVPALLPNPVSHPPQVVSASTSGSGGSNLNLSNDWYSARTGGSPTGFGEVGPLNPSAVPKQQSPISLPTQPSANDSKALVVSGNGFTSSSGFGGDMFSATSFQQKQESSVPGYSASSVPTSSAIVPASSEVRPSAKPNALDSLQSAFSMLPAGNQLQQARPAVSSQPQVSSQGSASVAPSGNSVGAGNSAPGNSQPPWPKMKPSDIQKYSKVFMEVDADRDGKITGEQARNLFLSWRLPREVLKHVWDLSDQDNDTMLSLREFCFALYLMERYREGRPLPVTLPSNVMFDETLLSMTGGPPSVSHGNAGWGRGPGFGQHPGMGARPITPQTVMRPPVPVPVPRPGSGVASTQVKPQVPVLEDPFANQAGSGEQNATGQQHFQEAAPETEKVEEMQNVILDSREKIEFYRTKMQDIVLFKSRCDNRLNEISERASADKREAEMLAKKYEEKYKQVAEIASKLTIEEARFREIQERKMELHQAIVNMEQGGSADGLLQVRADRIQSDLEELMKALTERCKKHGLDIQSKALVELPAGWQPGIEEGAALWDEEWDKFEDEGFGNELTFNATKQTNLSQKENEPMDDDNLSPDSSSRLDDKSGHFLGTPEQHNENESAYTHSEDESLRSPRDSPVARTAVETPSPEYSHGKSAKSDPETNRFFDDSNWGAFDTNDETDSVWGFNASKSKDSDFFGSSDFGVNPVRTDSPTSEITSHRKTPFAFDDSVPSTPLSRFGNSSPRFSNASSAQDNLDGFSRFDSFSMNDTGFDSTNGTRDFGGFSRFDSISSSRDFGGGGGFSRFDSISSSRDFGGPTITRFDSLNSTKDFGSGHGFSFDDSDPFGSNGPFKAASESTSPKKSSDNR